MRVLHLVGRNRDVDRRGSCRRAAGVRRHGRQHVAADGHIGPVEERWPGRVVHHRQCVRARPELDAGNGVGGGRAFTT